MKIAVTAKGKTLDCEVDQKFGRAAGFIVYDTDSKTFEAVDNAQNVNAMQGAGIQAAQKIAEMNVDALITGHCGPNAYRTLTAGGVKTFSGASGTVQEALDKYQAGELQALQGPDVGGHW